MKVMLTLTLPQARALITAAGEGIAEPETFKNGTEEAAAFRAYGKLLDACNDAEKKASK